MKEVYIQLMEARELIKQDDAKKDGENTYSDYEYFSPDNVSKLTHEACKNTGLITLFNMSESECKHEGSLKIVHIESGQEIEFKMPSDIPELKATNATQKMGGMYTYTRRYLLMNAFDISDNSEDLDNKDNSKLKSKQNADKIEWLSEAQFKTAMESDIKAVIATLSVYGSKDKKMKKEYREKLTARMATLKQQ